MDIKIFEDVGWGYSKLAVVVDAALKKLEMNYELNIIGNSSLFPQYNLSNLPALVLNDEVVLEGYVPKQEEMIRILKKHCNDNS